MADLEAVTVDASIHSRTIDADERCVPRCFFCGSTAIYLVGGSNCKEDVVERLESLERQPPHTKVDTGPLFWQRGFLARIQKIWCRLWGGGNSGLWGGGNSAKSKRADPPISPNNSAIEVVGVGSGVGDLPSTSPAFPTKAQVLDTHLQSPVTITLPDQPLCVAPSLTECDGERCGESQGLVLKSLLQEGELICRECGDQLCDAHDEAVRIGAPCPMCSVAFRMFEEPNPVLNEFCAKLPTQQAAQGSSPQPDKSSCIGKVSDGQVCRHRRLALRNWLKMQRETGGLESTTEEDEHESSSEADRICESVSRDD